MNSPKNARRVWYRNLSGRFEPLKASFQSDSPWRMNTIWKERSAKTITKMKTKLRGKSEHMWHTSKDWKQSLKKKNFALNWRQNSSKNRGIGGAYGHTRFFVLPGWPLMESGSGSFFLFHLVSVVATITAAPNPRSETLSRTCATHQENNNKKMGKKNTWRNGEGGVR